MSKHRFSEIERYALFLTHHGLCFRCGKPVTYAEVTVEHLIPEHLENTPQQLQDLVQEYGLNEIFPDFAINSVYNWVPAHMVCNGVKGRSIASKAIALSLLEDIRARVPVLQRELARLSGQQQRDQLAAELSLGTISGKDLRVAAERASGTSNMPEPLVITYGLRLRDVVEEGTSGDNTAALCDWLEHDLAAQLEWNYSVPFHYAEPSERNSETLSVRMVFPTLTVRSTLPVLQRPYWQVVEVTDFFSVYETPYHEAYL